MIDQNIEISEIYSSNIKDNKFISLIKKSNPTEGHIIDFWVNNEILFIQKNLAKEIIYLKENKNLLIENSIEVENVIFDENGGKDCIVVSKDKIVKSILIAI